MVCFCFKDDAIEAENKEGCFFHSILCLKISNIQKLCRTKSQVEEIAFSCGIIKKTKIFIKKRKICYVGVDFVWIFLHICGVLRAGVYKECDD